MIRIACVIQIDNKFYVDKDFKLTKDLNHALTIFGRHQAKKMALILQNNGMKKVKVLVKDNV